MTPRKPKRAHKKSGRPTAYDVRFDRIAGRFALLGATDVQLAGALGVTVATLTTWKKKYPTFLSSLKSGKDEADSRVVASLFQRATGCSHKAVKILAVANGGNAGSTVEQVPYVERYPPDATSMIFWLKNRRPAEWRDRVDVTSDGEKLAAGVLAVPLPLNAAAWGTIAAAQQAGVRGIAPE